MTEFELPTFTKIPDIPTADYFLTRVTSLGYFVFFSFRFIFCSFCLYLVL